MSDKPETLAAILAEMRDFADHRAADAGGERPGIELLRSYADRIEAAAERERAITDIMLAVKDKPLPHPDPDNAPPLFFPMTKTQLQTLSDLVAIAHDEMDGLPRHEQELERFDSLLFDMKARYAFDKPYAALSAPARNCDHPTGEPAGPWFYEPKCQPCRSCGYQTITPRTPAWDDPGNEKEEKK